MTYKIGDKVRAKHSMNYQRQRDGADICIYAGMVGKVVTPEPARTLVLWKLYGKLYAECYFWASNEDIKELAVQS